MIQGLKGRSILITGGTGSFGSKFIKMLLEETDCDYVRSYSRDEHKNQQLRERFGIGRFDTRLGDIRDKDRLRRALEGIDWVVHAAALKQAPLGEIEPLEFVKTNIYGTQNLIESVLDLGTVSKVLLISTDKAVQPINLYGATKMVAERIVIQANELKGSKKIGFSCTRYGNVAGSRSTIVPLFLALRENDPVPVTNLKATRFWIELRKANEFVLNCLSGMGGGEIFIPKIPSVRVIDVANALCPRRKMKIIGDREGDKLHETLIASHEKYLETDTGFTIAKWGKHTGLDYTSDKNDFLSLEEIRDSVKESLSGDRENPFLVKL